ILTGAGPTTFCAGGDLRYFATLTTREACLHMSRRMQALLDRLYFGDRVVIAAVNGQALGGGCEILTACHFRIAAESAVFAFRQAPNGIITGWGGGRRLFRLIGRSQALRLLLTGERIDAAGALRLGLVDQVVPADQVLPTARALAESITCHAPEVLAAFLKLARAVEEMPPEKVAELETQLFADLWIQPPFQEFLRKFK
ncbi:MAG: enoyl-CoA hydratase/isomerase family protein, partial [Calditrichaeota bacterium]